jgi:serine/threonine protein kinase
MTPNSLEALGRIVDVADRFESAWRHGLHPRIEAFLDDGPPTDRGELLQELLRIELQLRRGRGETPRAEEYAARFPLDRERIDAAFSRWTDESESPATVDPPSVEATMPTVPGYRFVRLLGAGGFSEVWLAEDENLFNRPVALKMIRPRTPPAKRRILLDALRGEAELLVSVHHPNLIQLLRWLDSPEETGMVLRYVAGGSLADRLGREGPLDWERAARYVADVAEGLIAAHRRGIVHRDVKPANILWDSENDEAILTDLGVGVRLGEPTSIGGTVPYMAPEAFQGRISPALDVYGLSATLFTLITGHKPFSGSTIVELCRQIRQGLPDPDPRCTRMPGPLERIVRRGLAADPELRPGLEEFVRTLRGTLNQLLADSLMMKAEPARPDATTERDSGVKPEPSPPTTEPEAALHVPVDLRLLVSRQVGPNRFVPIAATRDAAESVVTRDMKRVPPRPERIPLRTGDRVRIEAVSNRHGFITVFNVGPTGNLSLLYPDEPQPAGTFTAPNVPANRTIQVPDVEMIAPSGRERLFAIWSRQPLPLHLDRLRSLVESRGKRTPTPRPYVATRDMKRVQQSVERLPADDWTAVSVELDHDTPDSDACAKSSP